MQADNAFAQLWCKDNCKVKQQQQRSNFKKQLKTPKVTRQINTFDRTDKSSKASKIDTVW